MKSLVVFVFAILFTTSLVMISSTDFVFASNPYSYSEFSDVELGMSGWFREESHWCEDYYRVMVNSLTPKENAKISVFLGDKELKKDKEISGYFLNQKNYESGSYELEIWFNGEKFVKTIISNQSNKMTSEERFQCYENQAIHDFDNSFHKMNTMGSLNNQVASSERIVAEMLDEETYHKYKPLISIYEIDPNKNPPDIAFPELDKLEKLLIEKNLKDFDDALVNVENKIKEFELTLDEKTDIIFTLRKHHENLSYLKNNDVFHISKYIEYVKRIYEDRIQKEEQREEIELRLEQIEIKEDKTKEQIKRELQGESSEKSIDEPVKKDKELKVQNDIRSLDSKISREQSQYDEYLKQYNYYEGKTLSPKDEQKFQKVVEKLNSQNEKIDSLIDERNMAVLESDDVSEVIEEKAKPVQAVKAIEEKPQKQMSCFLFWCW